MEIYLIRHTSVNCEEGICYGQSDVDISYTFDEELDQIKSKLGNIEDAIFFSSPLKRCKVLAGSLSQNYIADKRLCELDFGDWELKQWSSINKKELNAWMEDYINFSVPNGECFLDLHRRSGEFWDKLLKMSFSKAVIITHAGIIRSLLAHILEMPLKNIAYLQINTGSITKISIEKSIINIEYINK